MIHSSLLFGTAKEGGSTCNTKIVKKVYISQMGQAPLSHSLSTEKAVHCEEEFDAATVSIDRNAAFEERYSASLTSYAHGM